MNKLVLGVGDFGSTDEKGAVVKTFALGSCVAIIFLDPNTHAVGMAHVALPESRISPDKAKNHPGQFADTAIPALLDEMSSLGCDVKGKGFIIKLVGGAQVMDPNNTFNLGKRNTLAIKKNLWKYGLGAVAEDVGKNYSRTVSVDVESGTVKITSPGREDWTV